MMFNDVDKSKPYTVLTVTEPVRLACFSFAGFARGAYDIQGDFRSKIAKPHDKRLMQVGLIALRYVSGTEQPTETPAPSAPTAGEPASTITQVEVSPPPPYDGWSPDSQPALIQHSYASDTTGEPAVVTTERVPANVPSYGGIPLPQLATEPVPVVTETTPVETVVEPVATEPAPVVTETTPIVAVTETVVTESAPVVTVVETTQQPASTVPDPVDDDQEPIVILDTPEEARPKKNKGGRPRKLKPGNVVAPAVDAAKLPEHEQDRRSAEPVTAPAEDSLPNENSVSNKDGQALA